MERLEAMGVSMTRKIKKEDARMSRAATTRASSSAPLARRRKRLTERDTFLVAGLILVLFVLVPGRLIAQTDCLACHTDKGLQDAAGHNISVDGDTFSKSIHGSLKCNDCHADIKEYPHPDKIAKVQCDKCHAGE